eukprot:6479443-Amphidinium_carterae.1
MAPLLENASSIIWWSLWYEVPLRKRTCAPALVELLQIKSAVMGSTDAAQVGQRLNAMLGDYFSLGPVYARLSAECGTNLRTDSSQLRLDSAIC